MSKLYNLGCSFAMVIVCLEEINYVMNIGDRTYT